MSAQLRRVVTITIDPAQEIGELEAGPVFTDEYTTMVCSEDPEDYDNLLRLDGIQENLVTDYFTEWSRVATAIAEKENLELYVTVSSTEEGDTDSFAAALHERISSQISVSGSGDAWFISSPLIREALHAAN